MSPAEQARAIDDAIRRAGAILSNALKAGAADVDMFVHSVPPEVLDALAERMDVQVQSRESVLGKDRMRWRTLKAKVHGCAVNVNDTATHEPIDEAAHV